MTIAPPSPIPRRGARAAHSALLALIALIALGSAAPAANAGAIAASAEDCGAQPLSTPFDGSRVTTSAICVGLGHPTRPVPH